MAEFLRARGRVVINARGSSGEQLKTVRMSDGNGGQVEVRQHVSSTVGLKDQPGVDLRTQVFAVGSTDRGFWTTLTRRSTPYNLEAEIIPPSNGAGARKPLRITLSEGYSFRGPKDAVGVAVRLLEQTGQMHAQIESLNGGNH